MSLRTILPLAFLPLGVLSLAAPGSADTAVTIKSHTGPMTMLGRTEPARDVETKVWIGGEKLRRNEGATSEIFRFDRSKLYLVNHADKTYSEIDLPIDLKKLVPKGNEAFADELVRVKQLAVAVRATDETRKLHGWNARKLQIEITGAEGLRIETAMWVSKDLAFYPVYNRMEANRAALEGNLDWSRKLETLDGLPVLQETSVSMAGSRLASREEVAAVETAEPPAGTYEVPAGYARVAYDLTATPGH